MRTSAGKGWLSASVLLLQRALTSSCVRTLCVLRSSMHTGSCASLQAVTVLGWRWLEQEHKHARSAHTITAAHLPQAARARPPRLPPPCALCSCAALQAVLVLGWRWLCAGERGSRSYMLLGTALTGFWLPWAAPGSSALMLELYYNCIGRGNVERITEGPAPSKITRAGHPWTARGALAASRASSFCR